MAFEQRDNSGALFVNDRKERDNHPDRTGKAMIDGVEYWVSGWLKETREGEKFLSLAFKAKDGNGEQSRRAPPPNRRSDMDDDIPF